MSIEAIAVCLHHSRAGKTDKLVLIGIANHEGDGGAWPSVGTLARYANCSERHVQRAISNLVELGEVEVVKQRGGNEGTRPDRRPNLYRVLVACPQSCDGTSQHRTRGDAGVAPNGVTETNIRGDISGANGVTPVSPEPSLEPSKNHKAKSNTSMTESWQPDQDNWQAIISRHSDVDCQLELDNFRDHWIGKGERRADWNASLRTWMRNADKWKRVNPADPPKNKPANVGPNGRTFCDICHAPWAGHDILYCEIRASE